MRIGANILPAYYQPLPKVNGQESQTHPLMKKDKKKGEFLDQLRRIPIVQVACEKTGISRNSVYRWRSEDESFRKEMEVALVEGEALVNDMSESQLLTMIKEKNWPAISFWLRHRNPKFAPKLEINARVENTDPELTSEQETLVKKSLSLFSLDIDEENTKT